MGEIGVRPELAVVEMVGAIWGLRKGMQRRYETLIFQAVRLQRRRVKWTNVGIVPKRTRESEREIEKSFYFRI